ncbi:MAG: nitronate monooxygenase [Pararhodobacter sp.]|nr:nitronate monooxygenase [Pararhodobacter sp.]
MEQVFRTRLTELFGIKHPVLVGGMMWLSTAGFVAACARAGVMAFMTPRSYPTPGDFRDGLGQAIDMAAGASVGVNLTIPRHTSGIPTQEYLEIAQKLGVRAFETAGSQPGPLIDAIKSGGGRVIHKCTRPRHALAAARDGADAVALVGMEAGGHPGTNPHPAHVLAAETLPHLTVPLALGGAIGTGGQILSALAQGAEGVVLGSRLLTAHEIWAHDAYKARLVQAGIDDTTTALTGFGVTWRVLANRTAQEVRELEARPGVTFSDFGEKVSGRYGRDNAYIRGDWNTGMLSCSAAAGFANRVEPVGVILDRLMADAQQAMQTLRSRVLDGQVAGTS